MFDFTTSTRTNNITFHYQVSAYCLLLLGWFLLCRIILLLLSPIFLCFRWYLSLMIDSKWAKPWAGSWETWKSLTMASQSYQTKTHATCTHVKAEINLQNHNPAWIHYCSFRASMLLLFGRMLGGRMGMENGSRKYLNNIFLLNPTLG